MKPALILEAMMPQDYNPEEHNLLMATIGTESGTSAMSSAILEGISPAPG